MTTKSKVVIGVVFIICMGLLVFGDKLGIKFLSSNFFGISSSQATNLSVIEQGDGFVVLQFDTTEFDISNIKVLGRKLQTETHLRKFDYSIISPIEDMTSDGEGGSFLASSFLANRSARRTTPIPSTKNRSENTTLQTTIPLTTVINDTTTTPTEASVAFETTDTVGNMDALDGAYFAITTYPSENTTLQTTIPLTTAIDNTTTPPPPETTNSTHTTRVQVKVYGLENNIPYLFYIDGTPPSNSVSTSTTPCPYCLKHFEVHIEETTTDTSSEITTDSTVCKIDDPKLSENEKKLLTDRVKELEKLKTLGFENPAFQKRLAEIVNELDGALSSDGHAIFLKYYLETARKEVTKAGTQIAENVCDNQELLVFQNTLDHFNFSLEKAQDLCKQYKNGYGLWDIWWNEVDKKFASRSTLLNDDFHALLEIVNKKLADPTVTQENRTKLREFVNELGRVLKPVNECIHDCGETSNQQIEGKIVLTSALRDIFALSAVTVATCGGSAPETGTAIALRMAILIGRGAASGAAIGAGSSEALSVMKEYVQAMASGEDVCFDFYRRLANNQEGMRKDALKAAIMGGLGGGIFGGALGIGGAIVPITQAGLTAVGAGLIGKAAYDLGGESKQIADMFDQAAALLAAADKETDLGQKVALENQARSILNQAQVASAGAGCDAITTIVQAVLMAKTVPEMLNKFKTETPNIIKELTTRDAVDAQLEKMGIPKNQPSSPTPAQIKNGGLSDAERMNAIQKTLEDFRKSINDNRTVTQAEIDEAMAAHTNATMEVGTCMDSCTARTKICEMGSLTSAERRLIIRSGLAGEAPIGPSLNAVVDDALQTINASLEITPDSLWLKSALRILNNVKGIVNPSPKVEVTSTGSIKVTEVTVKEVVDTPNSCTFEWPKTLVSKGSTAYIKVPGRPGMKVRIYTYTDTSGKVTISAQLVSTDGSTCNWMEVERLVKGALDQNAPDLKGQSIKIGDTCEYLKK